MAPEPYVSHDLSRSASIGISWLFSPYINSDGIVSASVSTSPPASEPYGNHDPPEAVPIVSPCRPNSTLLFPTDSASGRDSISNWIPLPSPLHPISIRQILRDYPDPSFVDLLCRIATYGTRIGYEGPKTQVRRSNHGSTFANPVVVSEAIRKEIEQGRIREIPTLPEHYYCSPIGLVPKKTDGNQTGWRLIFDLSCPPGKSVNDNIPKSYGALTYETLQHAIKLVAKVGQGAVMMKRDLKSAFRFIPVSPADQWCLLFEWQGKIYMDLFLPFGLLEGCQIVERFRSVGRTCIS